MSGDASGSTPLQADGTPVLPTTGFLSLPNELLVKIARNLAPNGGRKAGSLRLVCRHLGRVVAPVTWSSIILPAGADTLDEIGAELLGNRTGNTSFIVSIVYHAPDVQTRMLVHAFKALPSLRRLYLVGSRSRPFVPAHGILSDWTSLTEIKMTYVDLSSTFNIAALAPKLSTLVVSQCVHPETLFRQHEGGHLINSTNLRHIDITVLATTPGDEVTDIITSALLACPAAVTLAFNCDIKAVTVGSGVNVLKGIHYGEERNPVLLTLSGGICARLFTDALALARHTIISILNWVGQGPLETLSLPVNRTFFVKPSWRHLSLPRLRTLVFDVDPAASYQEDLLSLNDPHNFSQLVAFLKSSSLPSLSTLHLRGWVDETGSRALSVMDYDTLAARQPLIFSLLGSLCRTALVEIRFENSGEHEQSGQQCIFSREAGDREWNSRLVKFW